MYLRIGTYNIKHGGHLGKNCQAIANLIAAEQLDIIGIQEVDYEISRSNKLNIIKEIAEYAQYPYYQFYKAINYSDGEYGLGIISKYPIEDIKITKLTHSKEQRILVETKITINEKILSFFVTHLELGDYESVRKFQFAMIKEEIKNHKSFVLVGDFNVIDWNKENGFFEYSDYFGEYQILNNKKHSFYTYHSDYNFQEIAPIDNIIVSKNFIVKKIYMIHNLYSDHNLLICILSW
mgnify:CR=1 FL=1